MESIYKLLYKCINSKKLEEINNMILSDYRYLLKIKELEDKFDLNQFKLDLFKLNDYSSDNIILMFRILEKHIYRLLKKSNKSLNYKDVINNNRSNNNYTIVVTDSIKNLKSFKVYLLFYFLNLKFAKNEGYLGLDFEFNTKVVALMQINFEQINKNLFESSLIFVFDPKQLDRNWNMFFVQKIICNENCYKILHGSDSLDIPFIYNELLYNDPKFIIKFNKKFIDTKFLCEYKYYSQNNDLGKCKIYHVLKNDGIISENKFNELLENEKKMGPIYDIIININKLSKELIEYTFYDVLYLYYLVKSYKILKEYSLINELTQFILLEKKNVTKNVPYEEISKINNYMFIANGRKVRLNDEFKNILDKYVKSNTLVSNLLKINYFKNTLISIYKFLFFKEVCEKNVVYEKISNEKIKYSNNISKINLIINTKNINMLINNFYNFFKKYDYSVAN